MRAVVGVVAREPLAHFAAVGLVLFLAASAYEHQTDQRRIVITSAHLAKLANNYVLQFGSKPDARTLEALVQSDLRDEVLFRQGKAMKLDQDDEIVRRRVVQKMDFLIQNLNAPAEPTDDQLGAYYDAHAARYATPPRNSFSHIYFSPEKGGDATARARALTVLKTLSNQTVRAPDLGDPFPDLYDFSDFEPEQISRLFGHTAFADAVVRAPVGRWSGPFKSGYGWHLLYVNARQAAGRRPLAQVRDTVRADYFHDAQEGANRAAFQRLERDYSVVRADKGTTDASRIGPNGPGLRTSSGSTSADR